MNSINFHSLKNIDVPAELRQEVLAIPERPERKPVGYFSRALRFAAAAAVFVIITAVSVVLFLNTKGQPPVSVLPSPTDDRSIATEPVAGQLVPPISLSTDGVSESPTAAKNSVSAEPSQRGAVCPDYPTVAPDGSPARENVTRAPNAHPVIAPTSHPDAVPSAETQAPQNPQPQTEEPQDPSQSWYEPTEGTWTSPRGVSTTIRWNDHPKDGKVYCRIESPEGEVFGDYDLFADERLMINIGGAEGAYIFVYWFANHIEVPFKSETDVFKCIIYGSDGNVLTTAPIHWAD